MYYGNNDIPCYNDTLRKERVSSLLPSSTILLWPLVVVWVYKMVDRGCVEKRPLCRSQRNIENARVSQLMTVRAGDRLEEVTAQAV